jgi:glycosyltransferase involved in cell wall biosynthesis
MFFFPRKRPISEKLITVGWIGSPSTFPYLFDIVEPLSVIGKTYKIRFIIIGGFELAIPNVIVENHKWSVETEVELINLFDIGIMPISKNEWAKGKCGFKLLQYMSCEIPVIATNYGANIYIVDGSVGFLADTQLDWIEAFKELIENKNLRIKMGKSARNKIITNYSTQINTAQLSSIIKSLI